jgi:hypothetical protein
LGYAYEGVRAKDGQVMKGGECDEYLAGEKNFDV